jgi:hypothetical protein
VWALAQLSLPYAPGPTAYYRDLIARAELPPNWEIQLAGIWSGDALADARALVCWAIARDINLNDARYMTLDSLLTRQR